MAVSTIDPNGLNVGQFGNRNLIINGAMQVAQRGTSFTADNVYTLDRWKSSDGSGGSPARTLTQEAFTLGQTDVPNAHYFLKHNQTAVTPNGNASLGQKVEDVTRFDGQTVTLSFYAKASVSMVAAVRFIQVFGTGGSPSSNVQLTENVTIGTSWQKYTVTKTLASLSGKTLGTDGVHTSSLSLDIELQNTSTFTFEATLFQLEYGSQSTPFEHRSYGDELARCQRYFFASNNKELNAVMGNSTEGNGMGNFPVYMRASPTPFAPGGGAITSVAIDQFNTDADLQNFASLSATKNGIQYFTIQSGGGSQGLPCRPNAIWFDAEL